MIILVNNDKDAFKACLDAINKLVIDGGAIYDRKAKAFLKKSNTNEANKVVVSSTAILRTLKFSKFIGLDACGTYCFVAKIISSPKNSKKDKFLFGAKLFGLTVCTPLALAILSLMLAVALVSFLVNLTSNCIVYLKHKSRKHITGEVREFKAFLELYKESVPPDCTAADLIRKKLLKLALSPLLLCVPIYVSIPFSIMLLILPVKFLSHPISYLSDKIKETTADNPKDVNTEGVTIEEFVKQALLMNDYPIKLEDVLRHCKLANEQKNPITKQDGINTQFSQSKSSRFADGNLMRIDVGGRI